MNLSDNIKTSAGSVSGKSGVKDHFRLLMCILGIIIFMFFIGPGLEKLSLIQPLVRFIDERNIDTSALYYTEIDEFAVAGSNMKNTMEYAPKSGK